MDFGNYGNYGFTFVIPATKKVLYKSGRKNKTYNRNYSSLKQSEQRDFLDKIMSDIAKDFRIKWVYESHIDNRLHIHGIIYDDYEEIILQFRDKFYTQVGYKSQKPYLKYSDIRLLNDTSKWLEYINKDQHIKSKYDDENDHFKSLDSGIVQINTRLDNYYNSLTTHLENDILDDAYKFGKTKNKYIIDL